MRGNLLSSCIFTVVLTITARGTIGSIFPVVVTPVVTVVDDVDSTTITIRITAATVATTDILLSTVAVT